MKQIKNLFILLIAGWLTGCGGSPSSSGKDKVSGPDGGLIHPPTGMVYIPPGEFIRGSIPAEEPSNEVPDKVKTSYQNETPQKELYLKGYYIDRYEVTFREFQLFLDCSGYPDPKGWKSYNKERIPNFPVYGVNWKEASAYAKWAGKRLPTEAEWEKAARGNKGLRYPWGNEYSNGFDMLLRLLGPVGDRPETVSPYKVHDLAANVAEWTESDFAPYPKSKYRGYEKGKKVVKGYYSTGKEKPFYSASFYRAAARYGVFPDYSSDHVGFRCAKDARPPRKKPYFFPKTKLKEVEEMVYVPAGSFIIGTDPDQEKKIPDAYGLTEIPYRDETPRHKVYLDGFYIDRYEVTIGQYMEFLKAKGRPEPEPWKEIQLSPEYKNKLPATSLTWYEAAEYAAWAGKRLPTEEEWEKTARGTNGSRFLWGETITKLNKQNFLDMLVPVDQFVFVASPYGTWGMSGNATEWTASWYEPYPGNHHPDKLYGKKRKVIKGASYKQTGHYFISYYLRLALRDQADPLKRYLNIGFRCASDRFPPEK